MDEQILKMLRGDLPKSVNQLLAEEIMRQLKTRVIGRKVICYNTVDSTNTVAFALAEQGMPEGTAVFAEGQKKGKGRLGRNWSSPKAKGIYISLILRPHASVRATGLITLLAAVSVAQAIRKTSGLNALIRWPNDILINNKKVCGILSEMHTQAGLVKFVVLGIGINVSTARHQLPPGASSLKEQLPGQRLHFSRLDLARELLRQLDREYLYFKDQGSAHVLTQWSNLSFLSGKRVQVVLQEKVIEGLAQDLDDAGALIVRLDNGFKQHVLAGDVVKVR
ncbi:MAG: biotin--[acetyl-CoA-carboxylase] ligase [Candidatus Omnitrophica bacterium]|nr:biotin--[acetyl-CoA-carboxylase] ligase [Candidatus Omnitrophota bacterium]